jgi:hypothetical protein
MKLLNNESPSIDDPRLEEIEETIVEPRKGRLILFSSGLENYHRVERVLSGQRFVLAFWFTCDAAKRFEIYLDGQAHIAFSHKMRQGNRMRRARSEL